MDFSNLLVIIQAPLQLTWQNIVMMIIGGVLIYLAIAKDYEPVLLLPIGFGAILTNLPLTGITGPDGMLGILYKAGITTELFPLFVFIAIGAMTDFGPLLEDPKMALLGAAGQFGIFGTLMLCLVLSATLPSIFSFTLKEAASIGIIGAIDGPTAIYVSSKLAPHLLWTDYSSGLQLYVPGSDHPTSCYAGNDIHERTNSSDALYKDPGTTDSTNSIPNYYHNCCLINCSKSFPIDCGLDVWQSRSRGRCCRQIE